MRSWIPVPGTTSGRLAVAALELFGAHGYAAVPVSRIAARADVTTGSLYHHFGHKADLYLLVRADVEQRVIDRVEGAAAVRDIRSIADLAPAMSVGFDYLVRAGFARLLGEPPPAKPGDPPRPDPIEQLIDRLLPSADAPVGALIAAAWRVALWNSANDPQTAATPRAALDRLLTGDDESNTPTPLTGPIPAHHVAGLRLRQLHLTNLGADAALGSIVVQ